MPVLGIAVLLAPVLLAVAGVCVWKALRHRRPRLLVLAFAALSLEALVIAAGVWQYGYDLPTVIAESDAPGTYVLLGEHARDEVRLLPDGRLTRTAIYRGVTQHQSGRWSYYAYERNGEVHTFVSFDELSPGCLRSTEKPGAFFHRREPDEVLCMAWDEIRSAGRVVARREIGGAWLAHWCHLRGQGLALCMGDEGFEYLKQ
jgi:hypothetical protein